MHQCEAGVKITALGVLTLDSTLNVQGFFFQLLERSCDWMCDSYKYLKENFYIFLQGHDSYMASDLYVKMAIVIIKVSIRGNLRVKNLQNFRFNS